MKKITIILILISLLPLKSHSQFTQKVFDTPHITPLSPNVASLGQFGHYPIGYYTGTPDITIPLYELEMDGLKIPIQLKNNSSGIRVAQEASWVGLGWGLQVGGSIVKEIRGGNDFGGNVTSEPPHGVNPSDDVGYYYNSIPWPPCDANNNIPNSFELTAGTREYQLISHDTQPDMFHFNFGPYSGTMCFDKENKGAVPKPIILTPTAYLDITYNIQNETWTIIDPHGFTYYFNTKDFTRAFQTSSERYNSLYTQKEKIPERSKMHKVSTSWSLDSIKSPKGKVITFEYKEEKVSTPLMQSESLKRAGEIPIYPGGTPSFVTRESFHHYTYSYSIVTQNILKKISFNGGTVDFTTSDRNDLEASGSKCQKLETLEVKNKLNNVIKKIKFNYSYMGSSTDPNKGRLMLNSIGEEINSTKKQQYKFTYYEGVLPEKNSFETDAWGYYNGPLQTIRSVPTEDNAIQFRALPAMTIHRARKQDELPTASLKGGKCIKPDFQYMKIGTLRSIEYPTGGKTEFIHEPHTFPNSFPTYTGEERLIESFLEVRGEAPNEKTRTFYGGEFTLEKATYIIIDAYSHPTPYTGTTPKERNLMVALIQKRRPGYPEKELNEVILEYAFNCLPTGGSEIFGRKLHYLEPGTYQLRAMREIDTPTGQVLDFKHTFQGEVSTLQREFFSQGGGLRIQEIRNTESSKILTKTKYTYIKNKETTGQLLSWPDFANVAIFDQNLIYENGGTGSSAWYDYMILGSQIFDNAYTSPYASLTGSAPQVAYSYVEEYNEDSTGKTSGKTTYKYFLEPAKKSLLPGFPFLFHPGNGSLLEKCEYNNSGKMLRKTTNTYSKKAGKGGPVKGLVMDETSINVGAKFYDLNSESWTLDKETVITYTTNSSSEIKTETSYQYHYTYWMQNYLQTTGSRGEKLEQKIKFPGDYTDNISKKMVTNNMVALPIEATDLVDGSVTSVSKTLYCDTLGMILPKLSYTSNATISTTLTNYGQYINQFKDLVIYDLYDVKGNPLQITGKDLIPVSYVWAYNGMYPIIEATNIEYTRLRALIGSSLINPLLTQNDLTQANITELRNRIENYVADRALVNFYTYKPLVGLLTSTNPLGVITGYEYDIFGRLTCIYEKKNESDTKKILQTYNYNYKNK